MFDQIIKELNNLTVEELNTLKGDINSRLFAIKENKKTMYTHDCFGSSNYHFGKHRHYAKVLTKIDESKTNGYAFVGGFLKVDRENLIPVDSYVIEVCSYDVYLYKVDDDSKELLLSGERNKMVSFIKEAKIITGL